MANEENPLDPVALKRLLDLGGPDLVQKMVAIFLKNGPERMRTARAGFTAKDLKVVEQAVHSLKSSAGNVGAMALMELAQEAEDLAESGRGDHLEGLLDRLDAELDTVLSALGQALKELDT